MAISAAVRFLIGAAHRRVPGAWWAVKRSWRLALALCVAALCTSHSEASAAAAPVAAAATAATAGPTAAGPATVGTYPGTVFRPDGKPAAGATVWLIGFDPIQKRTAGSQPSVLATTTTDAAGRFTLAAPAGAVRPHRDARHLLALLPGAGAGLVDLSYANPDDIEIDLQPVHRPAGRVVTTAGKPVPGAAVTVTNLNDTRGFRSAHVALPAALASRWTAVTGADGSFKLAELPAGGSATVRIAAPGFGAATTWLQSGSQEDADTSPPLPVSITLRRLTTISGRVLLPAAPNPAAGLEVWCEPNTPQSGYSSHSWPVDASGAFTAVEVPPGAVKLTVTSTRTDGWLISGSAALQVHEGEHHTGVVIPTTAVPVAAVTVRVVDAATGRPLPGVRIGISEGSGGPLVGNIGVTDDAGSLRTQLAPGQPVLLGVQPAPGDAAPPPVALNLKDASPVELPVFRVSRVPAPVEEEGLAVEVVDAAGEPVHGAEVTRVDQLPWNAGKPAWTDRQGLTHLAGLQPGQHAELVARTRALVSAVVKVKLDGKAMVSYGSKVLVSAAGAPVRLILDPKMEARFQLRLLDQHGRPVQDAVVRLSGQTGQSFIYLDPLLHPDSQGRVVSGPLSAGRRFLARVSVPGCTPVNVPEWLAEPGQTWDPGPLVLQRGEAAVAGRVLDAVGAPVAGARVWTNLNQSPPVQALTDARGSFHLAHLPAGSILLVAQSPGGGLGLGLAAAPTTTAAIHLEPASIPATGSQPSRQGSAASGPWAPSAASRREALARASRRLAEHKPDSAGETAQLLACLAETNPARAADGASRLPAASASWVYSALGDSMLQRDPRVAASYYARIQDAQRRCIAYLRAARQLPPDRKAAAAGLLEQAMLAARTAPAGDETSFLRAVTAQRMLELGMPGAREALKAAAAAMLPIPGTDQYSLVRAQWACVLVDVDPDRAQALVKPPVRPANETVSVDGEGEAMLAAAVWRSHPALAQTLLKDLQRSGSGDSGISRICKHLAPVDAAQADALAATIQQPGTRMATYLAMALPFSTDANAGHRRWAVRWLAKALAQSQPDFAENAGYQPGNAELPRAALVSRNLGLPGAHALALQAAALHFNSPRPGGPEQTCEEDTSLALELALSDETLARQLLDSVIPRLLALKPSRDSLQNLAFSRAVLLAGLLEPERCAALLRAGTRLGYTADSYLLGECALDTPRRCREALERMAGFGPRPEDEF